MEVSPGMLTLMQPLCIFSNSQGEWPCAVAQVIIARAALTGSEVNRVSPYLVCLTIGAMVPPLYPVAKDLPLVNTGFPSPKKKPPVSEPDLFADFMLCEGAGLVKIIFGERQKW